jgi:DNA-binding HxlR family transcriptional regulator
MMRIINHPVRMRIIELLATKPMSWKELSGELGVRTGSLYHHLDTLERIVTRDEERRYALTPLGREIYAELNAGNGNNRTPAQKVQGIEKVMKKRTFLGSVREVFVPRGLIVPLTSTRARSAATLVVISAVVVGLLAASGDELVLFSFSPGADLLASVATYLASLLGLAAVAYIALAVAFKERGDVLTLLTSSALSFIPLCLFGAALHILYADQIAGAASAFPLSVFASSTAVTVVFAFFQAWGAGVVGAGMSVASGLRVEKTLLVSLVLLYTTMLLILVQGGRLT